MTVAKRQPGLSWRGLPGARLRQAPKPARRRGALALAATLLAVLALVGCGSASTSSGSGTAGAGGPKAHFAGAEASPPAPAPPLRLRNYLGEPVDLAQLKGRAVLLTFIYTHCPDTCPLIVSHMRTALALLGHKARDVQVVAVSTDPRGDTRKAVAAFVRDHGMVGRMDYLIGSSGELGPVWRAWKIVAKPAKSGRDRVGHSALVYGIAADGKVTTLYPANFRPTELAHDVPLLAEGS